MKIRINKFVSLTLLMLICFLLLYMSYSVDAVDFSMADEFIEAGRSSTTGLSDLSSIGTEFTSIGQILTYIGSGVLVGAMAYMGILYIISPPEKQAKLKQQLIGLVVSAVVIFGAYYIWKFIVELLENVIG